jgi:DNA-binding NarL/FixJ family response regulator
MKIGVVIADDQALVRGGFSVLVDSAADMEVLGEATNGAEAVALARRLKPAVVLMDVRMPIIDGIQAAAQITVDPATPEVRVLILTTFDLDEYVYAALRAGASGFMLKDTSPAELLAGIRIVAAGDGLLSPRMTRQLIQEFAKRPESTRADPAVLEVLTEREREVLEQVAHGLSNTEIAQQLNISPSTAKTHVSRILTKLDARDRAQLVVLAYETGFAASR